MPLRLVLFSALFASVLATAALAQGNPGAGITAEQRSRHRICSGRASELNLQGGARANFMRNCMAR